MELLRTLLHFVQTHKTIRTSKHFCAPAPFCSRLRGCEAARLLLQVGICCKPPPHMRLAALLPPLLLALVVRAQQNPQQQRRHGPAAVSGGGSGGGGTATAATAAAAVPPSPLPTSAPCACNNIVGAGARAACCQRHPDRCRLTPASNSTGFPFGLCLVRQPAPPPHLFSQACNGSDLRQQWDLPTAGAAAPVRNRAHGQCVSTKDVRRKAYNPGTGPYETSTVIWAHAPVVVVSASECEQDGSTFTYDSARQTLAVAGFAAETTPFGRGKGGCLDLVSLNYSVSASTDM